MITMGIVQEYTNYIQDNPEGYWFKRKLYGWGWTPATWQGWAITLAFITLIALLIWRFDARSYSEQEVITVLIPQIAFLILLLMIICYKTGERPKWQWGIPKKDSSQKEDITRSP